MQQLVAGYVTTPNGGKEPYQVEVDALAPGQAVAIAVELAELRGKRFTAETVQVTYRLVGVCGLCDSPVFEGGTGRSRGKELRCFDCGGGFGDGGARTQLRGQLRG